MCADAITTLNSVSIKTIGKNEEKICVLDAARKVRQELKKNQILKISAKQLLKWFAVNCLHSERTPSLQYVTGQQRVVAESRLIAFRSSRY